MPIQPIQQQGPGGFQARLQGIMPQGGANPYRGLGMGGQMQSMQPGMGGRYGGINPGGQPPGGMTTVPEGMQVGGNMGDPANTSYPMPGIIEGEPSPGGGNWPGRPGKPSEGRPQRPMPGQWPGRPRPMPGQTPQMPPQRPQPPPMGGGGGPWGNMPQRPQMPGQFGGGGFANILQQMMQKQGMGGQQGGGMFGGGRPQFAGAGGGMQNPYAAMGAR